MQSCGRSTICCVAHCRNRYSPGNHIKFFRIPTGSRLIQAHRRKLWLDALKKANGSTRGLSEISRVCGAHFVSGEASSEPHKSDYVPSLFPRAEEKQSPQEKVEEGVYSSRKRHHQEVNIETQSQSLGVKVPTRSHRSAAAVTSEDEHMMTKEGDAPMMEIAATKQKTNSVLLSIRVSPSIFVTGRMNPVVVLKPVLIPGRGYFCEVCGQVFAVASSLIKHKRIHGAQPHSLKEGASAMEAEPGGELAPLEMDEEGFIMDHISLTEEQVFSKEESEVSSATNGRAPFIETTPESKEVRSTFEKCAILEKRENISTTKEDATPTMADSLITPKKEDSVGVKGKACLIGEAQMMEVEEKAAFLKQDPLACGVPLMEGGFFTSSQAFSSDNISTNKESLVTEVKAAPLAARPLTPSGNPLFPCNMCDRSFTSSQNLKRHKLLHVKDGRKCPKCGVLFCRRHKYILFVPRAKPQLQPEDEDEEDDEEESTDDSSEEERDFEYAVSAGKNQQVKLEPGEVVEVTNSSLMSLAYQPDGNTSDPSVPPLPQDAQIVSSVRPSSALASVKPSERPPLPAAIPAPPEESVPLSARPILTSHQRILPAPLKVFSPKHLTSSWLKVYRNFDYIFSKPKKITINDVKKQPAEVTPTPPKQQNFHHIRREKIAYDLEFIM